MTNYDAKEEKALEKIAVTIDHLDDTLGKYDDTENSKLKSWVEQRKATYEIKKILHEAGKYDKYSQEEYDDFINNNFN